MYLVNVLESNSTPDSEGNKQETGKHHGSSKGQLAGPRETRLTVIVPRLCEVQAGMRNSIRDVPPVKLISKYEASHGFRDLLCGLKKPH